MATKRTTKSTKRRGPLKGRSLVAVGLIAFIAVAGLVVWRRSVGVSTARAMQQAEALKRSLESERTTLERDIRDAQSRRRVVSDAEKRLGFHVAPDSQTRMLRDAAKAP
jgi:type II secretory pathway component PulJ